MKLSRDRENLLPEDDAAKACYKAGRMIADLTGPAKSKPSPKQRRFLQEFAEKHL